MAQETQRTQPETFRARTLQASMTVNDLQKSVKWYRDVAHFMVAHEYERDGKVLAVALKAGTVEILLTQDDGARGTDRIKGQGISLQFTTAQDIDQLAAGIKQRGGVLVTEPADMPWGARVFRVRDPDGFALVFSSERPDA